MKIFNGLASGHVEVNNEIFDVEACHGLVIIRGNGFIYKRIDIKTHFLQTGKMKSRRITKGVIKKIITDPLSFSQLHVIE